LALAVLVVATLGSVWAARRHPGTWIPGFARVLALLVLAGWVGEYVAEVVVGTWTLSYSMPLQLTDAVSAAAIVALWTGSAPFTELLYFWTFTASLQAVLTPDLAQRFPSIFYFTYFTYHVGAVVAAAFLVFGCRMYPRRGAVWRVYAATLVFTVAAAVGDLATGGNYMYLRTKPVHSSLLSVMSPWPWYIVETAALGLVLLLAVDAVTRWIRIRIEPDSSGRSDTYSALWLQSNSTITRNRVLE
jgi:hypothetical integral membrane protein (TIGR02206 family)